MKILVICNHGKNRSRYLANYLANKGYQTKTAGILFDTDIQDKINDSDIVITVKKSISKKLKDYNLNGKKLITLDVEDRPEKIVGKKLDGDEWIKFQNKNVYAKLQDEIDKYLPF